MILSLLIRSIFVLVLCAIGSTACNFDEDRPGPRGASADVRESSENTAAYLMSKVLAPNCIGCHNHSRASGGINLSSLQQIFASMTRDGRRLISPGEPENSAILQVIVSGEMPPQENIATRDIEILRCWILADASTEDSTCLPADETTPNLIIVIETDSQQNQALEMR